VVKNDERREKRRPTVLSTIDRSHLVLINGSALTKHQVFHMNSPIRSELLSFINSRLECSLSNGSHRECNQ